MRNLQTQRGICISESKVEVNDDMEWWAVVNEAGNVVAFLRARTKWNAKARLKYHLGIWKPSWDAIAVSEERPELWALLIKTKLTSELRDVHWLDAQDGVPVRNPA